MSESKRGGFRIGAGRKATGKNFVNITLTLSIPEAQVLKERAENVHLSVSRFIAEALKLNVLPENTTSVRDYIG